MNKWGRFLSVAHIPQRLKPGSFFLGFAARLEAVSFPVVVNPPVLAEQNLLGLGCETQSACVFASQAFLVAVRQTFRS